MERVNDIICSETFTGIMGNILGAFDNKPSQDSFQSETFTCQVLKWGHLSWIIVTELETLELFLTNQYLFTVYLTK